MSNRPFKAGDKVFATENSAWGLQPMIVVAISNWCVSCKHPTMGVGGFPSRELEHYTK